MNDTTTTAPADETFDVSLFSAGVDNSVADNIVPDEDGVVQPTAVVDPNAEGVKAAEGDAEGVKAAEDAAEDAAEGDKNAVEPIDAEVLLAQEMVMADGSTISVSDLVDGHMASNQITQATTRLHEQQSAADAFHNAAIAQYQEAQAFMEQFMPPEPDIALLSTDPPAYQMQVAMRARAVAARDEGKAKLEALGTQQQTQNQTAHQSLVAQEKQALTAVFPSMRTAEGKAKLEKSVGEAAKLFGFTQQEIESTVDHRVIHALYFAALGKAGASKGKATGAKVRAATGKPVAKGPSGRSHQAQRASAILKKRGYLEAGEVPTDVLYD